MSDIIIRRRNSNLKIGFEWKNLLYPWYLANKHKQTNTNTKCARFDFLKKTNNRIIKEKMTSAIHGKPQPGQECKATFEAIDASNYVEFQAAPSGKWAPCG